MNLYLYIYSTINIYIDIYFYITFDIYISFISFQFSISQLNIDTFIFIY